jgi:hypothetical protein
MLTTWVGKHHMVIRGVSIFQQSEQKHAATKAKAMAIHSIAYELFNNDYL